MSILLYAYDQFVRICYKSGKVLTFKQIEGMYIKTDRWHELRTACLVRDNHRCRLCNAPATCVHHRRYPPLLGEETVDDLTSLCHKCHHNHHYPPSIDDARKALLEEAATPEGTVCPVCKTDCKIYPRSLYFNMVKHLIKLSHLPKDEDGWCQIGDDALGKEEHRNFTRAEYQKLRHFNLIEKKQPGDKRDGVWWRVTNTGDKFIKREIKVPATVLVLNGKVLEYSKTLIDITEALNTEFNYQQLMAGVDVPPPDEKKPKKARKPRKAKANKEA